MCVCACLWCAVCMHICAVASPSGCDLNVCMCVHMHYVYQLWYWWWGQCCILMMMGSVLHTDDDGVSAAYWWWWGQCCILMMGSVLHTDDDGVSAAYWRWWGQCCILMMMGSVLHTDDDGSVLHTDDDGVSAAYWLFSMWCIFRTDLSFSGITYLSQRYKGSPYLVQVYLLHLVSFCLCVTTCIVYMEVLTACVQDVYSIYGSPDCMRAGRV